MGQGGSEHVVPQDFLSWEIYKKVVIHPGHYWPNPCSSHDVQACIPEFSINPCRWSITKTESHVYSKEGGLLIDFNYQAGPL